MKTTKVILHTWTNASHIDDLNLEIDWPRVQKEIGEDCLRWLLDQPKEHCQLVLENTDHYDRMESSRRLVAEFYNEKTAVSYHLMWAK